MQYLKMLPYQIREAIDANTPAVLPLGVVEYHAEHLPLGVDCFTCINAIERVEKRHPEIVVLPPFYYGGSRPDTIGKVQESERVYIEQYLEHPFKTDWRYFWGTVGNILFRGARSK